MLPPKPFLALLFAASVVPLVAESPALRWIELPNPQLEVNGLPWYQENHFELIRLPARLQDSFPKAVWGLAQEPSGGRIRFRTDSTAVAIRLEYPEPPNMRNMHAFGQAGVDLYLNGAYAGTATPGKDAAPGKVTEFVYYDYSAKPRVEREITLYLPLYMAVKVRGIGLDPAAHVVPAKRFDLPKPLVFYGTSITQGGCASRSGMSYQAILGRMLNVDFVNLGFSGNGKGEPALASAVASIDAAAYVLDFAVNNESVESLKAVYAPFLDTVRRQHPETPIVCVTPIYGTGEFFPHLDREREEMRGVVRQAAAARIAAGDRNVHLVEGTDLLGPAQGAGLVDGVHPNDLGFEWMAEGLANRLRTVLGLTSAH
jgi:hypothetical protein